MGFVSFMRSWAGRLLRITVDAVIVWFGWTRLGGTAGTILALIGLVPIAAGVFNLCLLAPFFSVDLKGRPLTGTPFSGKRRGDENVSPS